MFGYKLPEGMTKKEIDKLCFAVEEINKFYQKDKAGKITLIDVEQFVNSLTEKFADPIRCDHIISELKKIQVRK